MKRSAADTFSRSMISMKGKESPREPLRVAGLFAGIGGVEVGLQRAGHETVFLCENNPSSVAVLERHYPEVKLVRDVADVTAASLPQIGLLSAGFPCQDLSQAGRKAGIQGASSGLVTHIFRILDDLAQDGSSPRWLLIENVQNMLRLGRGKAMSYIINELTCRGFNWAYRVVDTQAFGLPQRRQRVILLASQSEDPTEVLMPDDSGPPITPIDLKNSYGHGFYWTEGARGLGWVPGGIPTLKVGSTVGIPSAPGVWMPDGSFVTPGISDAERLQGFDAGWTSAGMTSHNESNGPRWKMIGNAVSVPVAAWVGQRLRYPKKSTVWRRPLDGGARWPNAASGNPGTGQAWEYQVSMWPLRVSTQPIAQFLRKPTMLSKRAVCGFRERTFRARLDLDREPVRTFLAQMDEYIIAAGGDIDELRRISAIKDAALMSGRSLRKRAERSSEQL